MVKLLSLLRKFPSHAVSSILCLLCCHVERRLTLQHQHICNNAYVMSLSVTLSPPSLSPFSQTQSQQQRQSFRSLNLSLSLSLKFNPSISTPKFPRFQASRRVSNFTQGNDSLADDRRNWSRSISSDFDDHNVEEDDDDEDEEEDDRSLDLLIKFVQNVFKKISRRARKAVRSVLPIAIPSNLVGFSVNGVLILAFLWVLKAFLEVDCTLGGIVFVSILLIRGMWTGITYLQENRTFKMNDFNDENRTWDSAQPVA